MSDVLSYAVLLPLSLIIWIALGFCQKRANSTLANVCGNRPGVLAPINYLNPRYRLVYSLVCAAQGSLWLRLIYSSLTVGHVNKWISPFVSSIVLILSVLLIVLLTYPMLACVEAPIPIVGYVIGLVYSFIYFIIIAVHVGIGIKNISDLANESHHFKTVNYARVIVGNLPQMFCIFFVIIWYGYKLIKEIKRLVECGYEWRNAVFEQPPAMYNTIYVKTLFKCSNKNLDYSQLYNMIHLPLPLLIATGISIVIMIQLSVLFATGLFPFVLLLLNCNDGNCHNIDTISKFIQASLIIAPILSTLLTGGLFGHLLFSVRKEIKSIRKGKSDLCEQIHNISWLPLKLTSYVRFTGYQVANLITGWVFYNIVFLVGAALFGLLIYLPQIVGYILYILIITMAITISILVIEALMCFFLFMSKEHEVHKTIILNNRRIFNYFMYTGLLYNIATGLYTNLIRVLMAFCCTLLIMPRLDKNVFVKPFEKLDSGHTTYLGFMVIDALLNNPIVHVFTDILNGTMKEQKFKGYNRYYSEVKTGYRFSQKARNRWFVAYTLMKNPSLRQLKSNYYQNNDDHSFAVNVDNQANDVPCSLNPVIQ